MIVWWDGVRVVDSKPGELRLGLRGGVLGNGVWIAGGKGFRIELTGDELDAIFDPEVAEL